MKKKIPRQLQGERKDIRQTRQAANKMEAAGMFTSAVSRLMDINKWSKYAGILSAEFQLADDNGRPVQGNAKEGLFIRIDIIGPGTKAGEGYDWVRIEEIVYKEDIYMDSAYQLIRVRPSADPGNPKGVAHFFGSSATSTFIVSREKLWLSVEIHGRNEKTSRDGTLTDKLRNEIVSLASVAGLSDMQWKSLAKGILGL